MNSKMIVKKFIHDLEQGWDSDFYKQNEDGELEFAASPGSRGRLGVRSIRQ